MPETPLPSPAAGTPLPPAARRPPAADGDAPADIRLPEGLGFDPQLTEDFQALARDLGLDSDGAQRLVDLYLTASRRVHDGWRGQTVADREVGGVGLPRTLAVAGKAIDRFGGPGLRQAFEATGAGNHPEVVRFCYRVGKALAEDGLVRPVHGRVARSYGETFYPKHKSKE